uniref:Spermatogenesis-defective protein 39 homolog n=1 Tax=Echeneis naucrates TaxID=173247 RepID=A0A665X6I7_ECHNA
MMKNKPDEEDYWNSSKFKAFTFDDEDDEFSRLKESKQAVNSIRSLVEEEDDEDEVEKVSWSGEPVGSKTSLSESSVKLYAPELRKPKSESKDYISDWSPEETIHRMQQGKVVSLERFRSLQDKLLLLDFSVRAHDGNIITAYFLIIDLFSFLCSEVLFRELESRQTALRHFIHYLTEIRDHRLLLELLRRDFLKSCLNLPFSPEESAHVQDHYTLLERQIIIEATDRLAEHAGKVEIFQKFPRRASILNMPLITTLYYCCFYHYNEPEGTYSSPLNIRHTFRISEKQYFVTVLAARAKLKAWSDLDALFTSRNWLGFTKKKSPLSFHRVVDILQKNSAPTQVLQEYVGLVDDADLRIGLAQKHKCHDIVINTYRDLKDRQLLLGYRGKVERGSAEERKINDLLDSPVRKRRNYDHHHHYQHVT